MTKIPHIHQLLPHEPPMALVDEQVDVGDTYAHCRVTISERCPYFCRKTRSVPGYVGIEFMAQTVAGWSGYHSWIQGGSSPIGFLLGSRRYQAIRSDFEENEVLDIYTEQIMENKGMAVFSCRIEHQGTVIASSQLNVFVPSPEKLEQMLERSHS